MSNLVFRINAKILIEFIKRVTADIGYRCERCEKLMPPGDGYEVNSYIDFGPWKHQIDRTVFLCDNCANIIKEEKDIDVGALKPENFI